MLLNQPSTMRGLHKLNFNLPKDFQVYNSEPHTIAAFEIKDGLKINDDNNELKKRKHKQINLQINTNEDTANLQIEANYENSGNKKTQILKSFEKENNCKQILEENECELDQDKEQIINNFRKDTVESTINNNIPMVFEKQSILSLFIHVLFGFL